MNDSAQADNLTPSAASSTFGAGGAGAMLRAAREAQGVTTALPGILSWVATAPAGLSRRLMAAPCEICHVEA